MQIDSTINIGHIFIVVSVLSSGVAGYYALRNTIDNHEWRLTNMEDVIKEQNRINRKTGETLSTISSDIAVIRHRTETPSLLSPAR